MWSEAEAEGLNSYSCPTCGAELVCDETTAATSCPYCGNPTVLGGKLSGKLKPEYILPFKLDKKTAIAQLTRYYKGKAFLSKAFKRDVYKRQAAHGWHPQRPSPWPSWRRAGQPAQVLPRVRQALWGLRGV